MDDVFGPAEVHLVGYAESFVGLSLMSRSYPKRELAVINLAKVAKGCGIKKGEKTLSM
jgi:hypothetical protein